MNWTVKGLIKKAAEQKTTKTLLISLLRSPTSRKNVKNENQWLTGIKYFIHGNKFFIVLFKIKNSFFNER